MSSVLLSKSVIVVGLGGLIHSPVHVSNGRYQGDYASMHDQQHLGSVLKECVEGFPCGNTSKPEYFQVKG